MSISAVPEAGNRCHVHILDLYLSKLPKEAFERDVSSARWESQKVVDGTSKVYLGSANASNYRK